MKENIKTNRPTIGLMLDTFFETYDMDIWAGVVDSAREKDVNLICFVGGALNSPYYHYAQRNAVYDLISSKNVDGLISISTSVGAWIEKKELEKFYNRFYPLPVVSIGSDIEGISSVVVDNRSGMKRLMDHLIKEHSYKKIAIICGPMDNQEAGERFAVYREKLEEYKIPFDPSLVAPGNFIKTSAARAISILVDERQTSFEAIITPNDFVAIEVIKNLQHRGYRIPGDVAVAGFDNIRESKYVAQPLTTVSQPTYDLGCRALKMVLEEVGRPPGKPGYPAPVEKEVLPTKLVIRRSCGCFLNKELDIPFSLDSNATPASREELAEFKTSVVEDVLKVIAENIDRFGDVASGWAGRLVDSLFEDLGSLLENRFLSVLENIVTEAIIIDIEVLTWHKIIIRIFSRLKQWIRSEEENLFIDNLYKRALEMIWEIAVRSLTYLKLKAEEKDELLFTISQAFITIFDIHKLGQIIRKELSPLGIKECFISLYPEKVEEVKSARLIVAQQDAGEPNSVKADMVPYPAAELIPGGVGKMKNRFSYIAMSLFYKDEQLGFALLDIGTDTGYVYETLVVQISSALKGIKLLGEVRKHADNLEAKVKNRTADLHEANAKLREEIDVRKKTAEILEKKNREIARLNKRLEQKSKIDSLTQLYNREAFFDLLDSEIQRTARNIWRLEDGEIKRVVSDHIHKPAGKPLDHFGTLTIMLIDIDCFKEVNDTHGHLVGDKVLVTLGKLFQRKDILRKEDFVGRFGGEEFIIVCPNTKALNARELGVRLSEEFKAIKFEGSNKISFHVTLSIGISEYREDDHDSISLIHRADKAMYWAKEHGRDQIVIYSEVFKR